MSELKTLATCDPYEFLAQTAKIKKAAEKWLTLTDILNIRKRSAVLEIVPVDATVEQKAEIFSRNKEKIRKQGMENFSAMFDKAAVDHPAETVELLCLCCFIEPKDARNYTVKDFMKPVISLLNDEDVLSFFTSLASLAQRNTFDASRA